MSVVSLHSVDWRRPHGFSLIEICISLIIIGILLSTFLSWYGIVSQNQKKKQTDEALTVAQVALSDYYRRHNRYPCPAALISDPSSPSHGREVSCQGISVPNGVLIARHSLNTSQNAEYSRTSRVMGKNDAYVGWLPARTLGLSDTYEKDGWGGRITYVVSYLGSRIKTDYTGQNDRDIDLMIVDGNRQPITESSPRYVLIAHGPDHSGELISSEIINQCNVASDDGENCDGDTVFIRSPYSPGSGPSFYNDILMHEQDIVYTADATIKKTLEKLISCQNKTAFFNPESPLSDENGCVSPALSTGTCANGQVMGGIDSNGQLKCVPNMEPSLCQGGKVLIGFSEDGLPLCNDLLLKIQSCAQAGLIFAGEGHPLANDNGCILATQGP